MASVTPLGGDSYANIQNRKIFKSSFPWQNTNIFRGEIQIRVLQLPFTMLRVQSNASGSKQKKERKRTLFQFEACILPRCQLIVEVEVRLDRAGLGGGGVLGGRLGGGVDLGVGCFRALREE